VNTDCENETVNTECTCEHPRAREQRWHYRHVPRVVPDRGTGDLERIQDPALGAYGWLRVTARAIADCMDNITVSNIMYFTVIRINTTDE
jgi:hypothetical protein